MPLTVAPCRRLCDWTRTPAVLDGRSVLACRGCGSQWVRGEPWTPAQADGSRPADVVEELLLEELLEELSRPAGGAGSEGS